MKTNTLTINEIHELIEQAQELVNFGNSKEKAEGNGMLKILELIVNRYKL